MTIIGNSNTGVTLSPQNPNVTITGAITGLAAIQLKGTAGSYTVGAAVQGGSAASFQILNLGVINTNNTLSAGYAGLVLALPGRVTNDGLIEGGSGLLSASYQPGGYINNAGQIEGLNDTDGIGAAFNGQGGLNNSGAIFGQKTALYLFNGGVVNNSGTIAGAAGLTAFDADVINSGTITGTSSQGAYVQGTITNTKTGQIKSYDSAAVALAGGGLTNQGFIDGRDGIIAYDGAVITNTGTIDGYFESVLISASSTLPNIVSNATGGVMDGQKYGIVAIGPAASTITNNGKILTPISNELRTGLNPTLGPDAYLSAIAISQGTVVNTGTAFGSGTGIYILAGPGSVTNTSTGRIQSYQVGVDLGGGGTLTNAGLIQVAFASGVVLADHATVINSGSIGEPGTQLPNYIGIYGSLGSNAFIYNARQGFILGKTGINLTSGDVVNKGTITTHGYGSGIMLRGGGTIINTGTIEGGTGPGITIAGGGTVSDSGLIAGSSRADSIDFSLGVKNLLILAPSATLIGRAVVNGGIALTAGAGTLTLANFLDIESLHFGAGSNWKILGALSPTVGIYNSTTLTNTDGPGITIAAPVYNYGFISGSTDGVMSSGAYLYNSGQIAGAATGIALTAPAYVINTGTVSGQSGVQLAANSQFYNYTGASIAGGLTATTNAALYNYARATITAPNTAISLTNGAAYNAGFLAAADGIILSTGTVTNLGTIAATSYAVDFTTNSAKNRLILAPTAITTGNINLAGGSLELQAARHKTGTLATTPANLAALTIDARAGWDFTAPVIAATLTNNGTLFDRAGLTLTGPLTGRGTIVLNASLTLAAAAATQKLAFAAPAETLTLTDPSAFAASIHNFAPADTIALPTIAPESITGETFAKNILTLTEATGRLTLSFASIPLHDTFSLIADGAGTGIILATPAALSFATPAPAETALPTPPAYTTQAAAKTTFAATAPGFLTITQLPTAALIPALTLQS